MTVEATQPKLHFHGCTLQLKEQRGSYVANYLFRGMYATILIPHCLMLLLSQFLDCTQVAQDVCCC